MNFSYMAKDYYKILGINHDASPEEIKKAYRRLAHQYHPDRPGGNEQRFKEISEAYQILSNQEKRHQYDQFGNAFGGGFNGLNWDFGFDYSNFEDLSNVSEIFDSFFEGLGVKKRKTYHRGSDVEFVLDITLEEAFSGAKKEVSMDILGTCAKCSGLGHFPKEGFNQCSSCDGRGEIKENRSTFFGSFSQIKTCSKCFGTGQIPNKGCNECRGTGRLSQNKSITINIALGIGHGQIIKVTGAGESGERGALAGDLYIKINIKPHPVFSVRSSDLFVEVGVSLVDLLLDKKIKIKGLSGKNIEIEIPAGANISEEFRVPGEGMPVFASGGRGDLYISFNVKLPKKLSAKARKAIEELKEDLE